MAKLTKNFTDEGNMELILEFKGETYGYTMIADEHGATGDKPAFDHQVEVKYPDTDEEVLELLENLSFADDTEIGNILGELSEHE